MYSKVEIFGECESNYLYIRGNAASNGTITNVVDKGLGYPVWSSGSILLADYEDEKLDGTPLKIQSGTVVGYRIQRLDTQKNILSYVAETNGDKTIVEDYVVNHNKQYRYYIFPIIKTDDGTKTLGSPIITDTITPAWDVCTIVGLKEVGKNEYVVDKDNIWRFQLNIKQESYELNMDKTFTDGFDRFPKRTQGIKKYVTSGMNSLMGTLECRSDKIDVGISDIERWEDFCYSSNLKLFNDMRGRIIPIDIKTATTGYLGEFENSPLVTNISFVQLADINNITVYGLDGE